MSNEPITGQPYQEAGSKQTDAVQNATLNYFGAWVNCMVLSIGATTPPSSPANGDRHIVGVGATGPWALKDGQLATYRDGWQFEAAPAAGVPIVKNLDDGTDWECVAGVWAEKAGAGIPEAPIDGQEYVRKNAGWAVATGGGGGGGGMALIGSSAAGAGGAASLTVGSIPGTYKALVILFNGRGLTAAQYIDMLLRFNADSGANYDSQLFIATATTPGYSANHGQTSLIAGYIAAASASANRSGSIRIDVPAYAGTVFDKEIVGMSSMVFSTSAGTSAQVLGGAWRPSAPAAITSVTLLAATGNLAEGSELLVYGLP